MMKAMILLFIVNSAGAAGLNPFSCLEALSTKAASSRESAEARFNQVIQRIRDAGAKELLVPLDNGQIQPDFKGYRMPWQAMISGREGWSGKLTLKVRDVKFADERGAQRAVWDTAMVLFELESRAALWSRRSMLTPEGKHDFDLSMKGSDESLDYFMYTQPREWRDLQIGRLEVLEAELYRLLGKLDQLKAEDLLPKKDPGRFWLARTIYGGDASRAIAPNLADYEVWKNGTTPDLRTRHGRNLLFNYYMNFLKRAVVLSLLAQVAVGLPNLQNLPGYLDAMFAVRQFTTELNESPSKSAELNQRFIENLKKSVIREEERLKKVIETLKTAAVPNGKQIESLEKELSELYDLYPWLLHAKSGYDKSPPSPPQK